MRILPGLTLLARTQQMICERCTNPNVQTDEILLTMYQANLKLTRVIEEQIRGAFDDHVFKTVISRNVDLAASPAQGLTIRNCPKSNRGCKAYHDLALEVKKLWL